MIRKHIFEDLPQVSDVRLTLDYTYSFTPGKYDGPPERCYPDEEESDISIDGNWRQLVEHIYANAGKKAIEAIERQVQDLLFDDMPRRWLAEGDGDDYDF